MALILPTDSTAAHPPSLHPPYGSSPCCAPRSSR